MQIRCKISLMCQLDKGFGGWQHFVKLAHTLNRGIWSMSLACWLFCYPVTWSAVNVESEQGLL